MSRFSSVKAGALIFAAVSTACAIATQSGSSSGAIATASSGLPDRAVRRDIPMTNAIRRAFAAGTRDSSGRPGRNYWQLRTDYTINARLDVATSRISGRETVVIRNASPDSLRNIALRLLPFIVRPLSRRGPGPDRA